MPAAREKLLPACLALLVANGAVWLWLHFEPLPPDIGPIVVANPADPASMPELATLDEVDAERAARFEKRLEAWRAERESDPAP